MKSGAERQLKFMQFHSSACSVFHTVPYRRLSDLEVASLPQILRLWVRSWMEKIILSGIRRELELNKFECQEFGATCETAATLRDLLCLHRLYCQNAAHLKK
ncbi:hypothetical protein TNCV_1446841 [Trichonephila clavipes]|nr:hypothetical protein TNCV_1446841 [Trichonephila clavipes]